jgi:diguanylate cyclase (GGDEF)-like protein/PAS domain S-box-containing protein
MNHRAQQLRHTLVVALLIFVCSVLAITAYTLWRLRDDAIRNGLEISAMHTRAFEDFLTQNLHVVELISANAINHADKHQDLSGVEASFIATLQHTPFLRSMSLLDEQGRVYASSNKLNIGIRIETRDFLPIGNTGVQALRFGQPWSGRDFSSGQPSTHDTPVDVDAQSLIPVTRTVTVNGHTLNMLFAINPDYFINHVIQSLPVEQGFVGILRYDGTLLMSTDPSARAGAPNGDVVSALHLSDVEYGKFEKDFGYGQHELTAFRASRLYPFVVITHIHRPYALRNWLSETLSVLAIILPAILVIIIISLVFYRRQAEIAIQRTADELALRRESEKNFALLQNASDGIHILDSSGNIIEVSDSFCTMLGYNRDEMIGMNVSQWDTALSPSKIPHCITQQMSKKGRSQFETRHKRKDGSVFDVEVSSYPLELDGKQMLFYSSRDITERKQALAALNIAATAFESQEGMLITDVEGKILRVNEAFSLITGYTAEDVLGQTPRILNSGRHNAAFYTGMWENIINTGVWKGEIWNRRKNGELYPEYLTITAVKDANGSVTNYVASLADITLRKSAEEEINTLAFYDALTGLPNRRLLQDRLKQALNSSGRSKKVAALLFIDLDNFKELNDTLGHHIGDILLQQVGQRLTACVREGDTIARLGGDEFVVILENLSEQILEAAEQTEIVGEKILAVLIQTYQLGQHAHHCSCSIGATIFFNHSQSVESLMKQADIAMYQAKKAGRNTLRFFDSEMQETISARARLEVGLRNALVNQQFQLYYQIQVDNNRCPTGLEVLIRWVHPERGFVSPDQFIPLAEETGLILQIGLWVLETACSQLAKWASQPELAHLTIAVNVSAVQFQQDDFADRVMKVIELTGANPHLLKLELTESMLIHDIEGIIAKMQRLKAIGVGFSLDDFGTGYSSLSYLSRLPLDQLKIDQSFVRNLELDSNAVAICAATISMAHSLNLKVVAEGVETEAQSYILQSVHSCDAMQGYLFGKPVPLEQFEKLLLKN